MRVSTETYAARSTSTKEKKLTSPPSRRSFAKRSPSTVLASRGVWDLWERSLIERMHRVYVVRADIRIGAAFAQADRETETDPVAHGLHVTRGVGLHPTPFITEAACLEPELDAALALQRQPRLGKVRRWPGRERLAGRVADHSGANTVDFAHGRRQVPGPQRDLGLDQPHLAAGREVDRRVPSRVFRGEEPGHVPELCGGYLGIRAPPHPRVARARVVPLVERGENTDLAVRLVGVDPVEEIVVVLILDAVDRPKREIRGDGRGVGRGAGVVAEHQPH